MIDEKSCATSSIMRRTIRFTKKEMIWLAGNSFYGRKQIFSPEFLAWLERFELPEYHLRKEDGQFVLDFPGAVDAHDHVGNPRARHHQRACARAPRCAGLAASRST